MAQRGDSRVYVSLRRPPVNGAHAGHHVAVAHPLGQQPVSDLPGEHGGILPLVLSDLVHNLWGGHLGLGAADHARFDAARLVVPAGETAVVAAAGVRQRSMPR